MIQARTPAAIRAAIEQYGAAPGGKKLMQQEYEAYEQAVSTDCYVSWRSSNGTDCARVGPDAKCFCGHKYANHAFPSKRAVYPKCDTCPCKAFAFVPSRPEEVGEWWLPRRKGFNINTWRAKCRCGHGHDSHDPNNRHCKSCGCSHFVSDFLCLVCDKHWEEHETVFETKAEREAAGRATGQDFAPLSEYPDIQGMVLGDRMKGPGAGSSSAIIPAVRAQSSNRIRPPQVGAGKAEKSVRMSTTVNGGLKPAQ